MIPIRELLDRIRWDPEFARSEFAVGYYDRIAKGIVKLPFRRIHFAPGEHFTGACMACIDMHKIASGALRLVLPLTWIKG
jgi:uncharacterized protein (UPF0248 family)